MFKMRYFDNKFSKIAKRWGLYATVNLWFWWSEVAWFAQIVLSNGLWWNWT